MIDEDVLVRFVNPRDYADVAALEKKIFQEAGFNKKQVAAYLSHKLNHGVAAFVTGVMVGFALFERQQDGFDICSIGVDEDARRVRVGHALLSKIKMRMDKNRRKITVMVRETNYPAISFFTKAGFIPVRLMVKPYRDSDEDGYQFEFSHDPVRAHITHRFSHR